MTFNNGELKLNKDFAEELIYENIRLHFKHTKIRESLIELKRLERLWNGTESSKESEGFSIAKQKVN